MPNTRPAGAPDPEDGEPATRRSTLLGGRILLTQPVRGYRAGLDASLLAAALPARPGEVWLEGGCGAGGALLQAAARASETRFLGVERDAAAAALARLNARDNGMEGRCEIRQADLLALGPAASDRFDGAFSNPPFFDDPSAIRSPGPGKRAAFILEGGLDAWCGALLRAVRSRGRLVLVHRADRLLDLLNALAPGAGDFRVRPVAPFADAEATRVLVSARKGGRGPLRILPPLVLRIRDGGETPEAEAVLRGEAALAAD